MADSPFPAFEGYEFDEDALIAGLDLCARSGAHEVELGYDDDDPANVTWYCEAKYLGARLFYDQMPGPVEAVERLARRLMAGATCRRCGKKIRLSSRGKGKGTCRWRRNGAKWESGCGKPIDRTIPAPLAKAERRPE